ncbi:MAG: hypothetical protein AAFR79_12160 [Pseudomonadota bacterium]
MARAFARSVLLAIALGVPAASADEALPRPPIEIIGGADPCALWETETAFTDFTYKLKLEDTEVPMRVPSAWLCGGERRSGLTHSAQLFWMRISDFTPLRCSASEPSAGHDGMSILLSDVLPQPDLTLVNLRQRSRPPLASYRQEPWKFGLTRHLGHARERRKDIFTTGPQELPDTLVRCGRKREGIRNPQCNTLFSVGDVDARLGFSRTELPNWRIIKDRAERILTCALDVEGG